MTLTQLQAVSTTTGAGKSFAQLAINIVIAHTLNVFLYITGPFHNFRLTFCRSDGSGGVLFGSLLIGFGFRLTGPASMADAERASDSTQDDNHQPRDSFDSHDHTTSTDFAFRKRARRLLIPFCPPLII
ncbi:hypothetical protein SM66_03516 [Klebsiella quasipneumoniae subsp. quasipneumoniae]|nr:hypothetical protein SM66_03516 [Klebsiella quasipneumoniae subsp. quasipneumoniae]